MQRQANAKLPDGVLQWLWNTLQTDYHNPQATYSDTVAALTAYPSLQPRTDVYTYNTGQPALLLCLTGTLPVNFRGTVYRFPLKLWIPHAHPIDPDGILVFVLAAEGMAIRPGQHVSVDGRVYHPYLRDWSTRPQSSMHELLSILQDVFAREPPVIAKQQQQQQQQRQPHPHSQPQSSPSQQRPLPPPKGPLSGAAYQNTADVPAGPNPPPKPPKPGEQSRGGTPSQARERDIRTDGPPLPPLPHERAHPGHHSPVQPRQGNGLATPPMPQSGFASQSPMLRGPPLPPVPQQVHASSKTPYLHNSPKSPMSPTTHAHGQYGQPHHAPHASIDQKQFHYAQPQHHQPPPTTQGYSHPSYAQPSQPQYHQHPPPPQPAFQQQPAQPHVASQPAPKQPALDLMSDPFDVSLPIQPANTGAPPPIPPNPEKEHLLHLLSTALVAQAHQKIQQNQAALPALSAQGQAMAEAHHRLQQELAQVEQLDRTLSTNESILHASIQQCDKVIADSKNMPEPAIDDVLVAPTLVQNQLWSIEADIAGLREVLWVLQRAVSDGRVGGAEFVKLNRGLARELFLKMALSRKIAKGLGLDLGMTESTLGRTNGAEGYYT